ncbi:hypothetical protein [Streptomyces sp. NPDC003996]
MRRIGSTPAQGGCGANNSCPDVLELDTGDFLVIGSLVGRGVHLTAEGEARMRELGASAGVNEVIVEVPRDCILAAAKQLAAEGLIT